MNASDPIAHMMRDYKTMSIEALLPSLQNVACFQGLDRSQLREIARRAERVVYKPGDFIIEEGQIGEAAILIVSGQAVRVNGPDLNQRTETVPPGSFIGEMAMLVEVEHDSTVIARNPMRALRFLRGEFLEHMTADTSLIAHFMGVMAERLNAMAAELRSVDAVLALPYLDNRGAPSPGEIAHASLH